MMPFFINILSAIYPLLVYFSNGKVPAFILTLFAMVLILLRLKRVKENQFFQGIEKQILSLMLMFLVVITGMLLLCPERAYLFYPVLINANFAIAFGLSHFTDMPLVERFARIRHSDLDPLDCRYLRLWNGIWVMVCMTNTSISAYTVFMNDLQLWTVFNTVISYVVLICTFIVEFLTRIIFKRYIKPHLAKGVG